MREAAAQPVERECAKSLGGQRGEEGRWISCCGLQVHSVHSAGVSGARVIRNLGSTFVILSADRLVIVDLSKRFHPQPNPNSDPDPKLNRTLTPNSKSESTNPNPHSDTNPNPYSDPNPNPDANPISDVHHNPDSDPDSNTNPSPTLSLP